MTYEVQIRRDVRIPTSDPDVTLSGDLYLPVDAGPAPAVLSVYPYRKDFAGAAHGVWQRWFAERGYACLLVEHAGIGSSDGVPPAAWGTGETDDAVAAIEWAAAQPWCDGTLGMWGISHGGTTTMGAASRGLPQLKAIIPIMNSIEIERGALHPDGARGDWLRLASWGGSMIMQQLLPPLVDYTSPGQQRRWQRRLHDTEPFIMDLARLAPGDPAWRERVIDAESITVPAMCVGGWQDLHCAATIGAYERVSGPKKLLIGPWGHTSPQDSPFEPIDFLPMVLRWWDRWLRGIDNGVMDEPPVVVYVQGDTPGWRSFPSWLPAKGELVLATGADTTLSESALAPDNAVIAEYEPDPTTGVLSGLRGIGLGSYGFPLDQHDDDMRALPATSEPLKEDVLICGRPEVMVRVDPTGGDVRRIVARLAEVDAQGRSTFITSGLVSPRESGDVHRIGLWPAAYRVRAGNRLRVVLSDSDFPRIVPLPDSSPIRIAGIEVLIPTVSEDTGAAVDVPALGSAVSGLMGARPDAAGAGPRWTITRDPIHDGIDITIGASTPGVHTSQGHHVQIRSEVRGTVRRSVPRAALTTGTHTATVKANTGETITVTSTVRCTQTSLWARGEVIVDDLPIFSRVWEAPLSHYWSDGS